MNANRHLFPGVLLVVLVSSLVAQDRFPASDFDHVFPEKLFVGYGGSIIDVTRIPDFISRHDAHPDGTQPEETTRALIDLYDYIVKDRDGDLAWGFSGGMYILYFPNGTYSVNDTIIYSFPVMLDGGHETISRIRFRGQSRKGVVIQLVDDAPGFQDKNHPRSVISFGKHIRNNKVSTNFFENITINTGKGNPGAVGLRFHGANSEAVRNVSIISGDGEGYIGLDLPMGACQGYYSDITVDGFDYGIHASRELATCLSFEYVTLRNQKVAGVWVEDVIVGIRKLTSINCCPAILQTSGDGLVNLIDSFLLTERRELPAIEIEDLGTGPGHLFARNVRTIGYETSVARNGTPECSGNIKEYVSGSVLSLKTGTVKRSLGLPIEATPVIPWNPVFQDWAFVSDFGAGKDDRIPDSDAIQRAMDSGKSQIFFDAGDYVIDKPIHVPASVRRINFMFSKFWADGNVQGLPAGFLDSGDGVFVITGDSGEPLLVEDLRNEFEFYGNHFLIDHAGKRTVILSDVHLQRGQLYKNSVEGGKVFIENCSVRSEKSGDRGLIPLQFKGQKVWIRYLNAEHSQLEVLADRSELWIFGFKKEGWGTAFRALNGSRLEIYNAFGSTWGWQNKENAGSYPILMTENSQVSMSAVTLGNPRFFHEVIVEETSDGMTRRLNPEDLPRKSNGHRILPLFVSRDLAP